MRATKLLLALFPLLAFATAVSAAELPGRAEVGDDIPSYASTKCGGIDDGVSIGKTLCYTCRAGDEPIFYVFAKKPNDLVAKLAKQIETIVVEKKDQKAAAVVNFLGDPKNESTRKEIADFGKRHDLKHVSLTITGDGSKFAIDDADEVTVILFEKGIIRLRNTVKPGMLDDKEISLILRRSKSLLK